MSDEIDIRHGTVVAVDTSTLRAVAADLERVRDRLVDAAALARDAVRLLEAVAERAAHGVASLAAEHAADLARALDDRAEETCALAARLRRAALVYEAVELAAGRDGAAHPVVRGVFDAALAILLVGDPGIGQAASAAGREHANRAPWELIGQAWGAGGLLVPGGSSFAAASAWLWGALVRSAGQGVVPSSARLGGVASPVVVRRVGGRVTAPVSSLQQLAARMPGEAAIRVERYTMPGGGREFVVYVTGTRLGSAFDMASNTELYGGLRSASYEAVRTALERSGARPGDVVHAVGHSQGGMIANRMALEREFDVETVVTFGSPVQAEVPASTLVVDLRHDDDVVPSLAGAGSAQGVGSPDSFVAQRTADRAPVPDLGLLAHTMGRYEETAALLDASPDPRMDAVRSVFSGLGTATAVMATEYTASRPEPAAPTPAPGPTPTPAPGLTPTPGPTRARANAAGGG